MLGENAIRYPAALVRMRGIGNPDETHRDVIVETCLFQGGGQMDIFQCLLVREMLKIAGPSTISHRLLEQTEP